MQNSLSIFENLVKNDLIEVAPGIHCLQIVMVNVYFVRDIEGNPNNWVLVDAGLQGSANRIKRAAAKLFGEGARPKAIILTHGHFDHVGALKALARDWNVPVYAHLLELPYVTGRSSYPPPDPTVGGGAMSFLSPLYPKKPINVSAWVRKLPSDGDVPYLAGWSFLHTPGHSTGHVSFFRESDHVLLAGDAFVTQKQESMMGVISQKKEIHGPPAYFTTNWELSKRSIERLMLLRPKVAATGHGLPMYGEEMLHELEQLFHEFDERALPKQGRYVNQPAEADETGVTIIPPKVADPFPKIMAGVGVLTLVGLVALAIKRRKNQDVLLDDHSFLNGIARF
ncbi:MBL fold metallo-hydrolase [Adhaeribacter aquaticus]|uniref:MBL fold metallo-hydrolase n=1 Tax=Adhaeribacter aquaticus TaxID=299567 RepID=UPI00040350F1|nr:MBL fold metallo-hydrolase [Adhaeribacter aquaticus]